MSSFNLLTRISTAEKYYSFLSKHDNSEWLDLFFEISSDKDFALPEILTLFHPKWHSSLGFTKNSDPRGTSEFTTANSRAKCRAIDIWGYQCPFNETRIEIDHMFPYSKGGATFADNAMYLCHEHNRAKSSDIHLLPWETFIGKDWIRFQLEKFIARAQTLSKKPLYFPEIQLKKI